MISSPPHPRFISSTILLGSFSIFNMLLGFGGIVIVTRHFTTEIFGAYTLILVVVSFLCQISALGLDMSISKFIATAKDDSSKERLLSTAVIMRIGSILLACLFCWFGGRFLILLFGKSLAPDFLAYIPLLFVMESLRTLFKSLLQGSLLFVRIGFTDLFGNSLNFILLFVVVYVLKGGITWLILAKTFSSFIACTFAFLSIPIKKRLFFHWNFFKELIKFGFPLQINDILSFINSRIDTLVVAALLGPSGIALYEIARKIPDSLRLLYDPFRQVYYPFLAKWYALDDKRQADRLVNDSTRFVAFFTLFGTAITVLFSEDIIRLLFSEKYLPSAPAFILLMINLSIALVSNVMGTTLVAVGDPQKPMIINIFNAIASWLGSILFIPAFGIIGAAIANTSGTALTYPPTIYFLRKKIDFKNAMYLKPAFLFCTWNLLVFLIKPDSFLLKIGFLGIFLVASVFLSIVTKADIVLLVEGSGITSWKPLHKLGMWISKL